MDKIKERQAASDQVADALGLPRRTIKKEWVAAAAAGGGKLAYDIKLLLGKKSNTRPIIRRLKARTTVLDDEVSWLVLKR